MFQHMLLLLQCFHTERGPPILFYGHYTPDQMKTLKTCTLLDIRYKTCSYVANDFGQLEKDVKEILGNPVAEQSQQETPATEGQELENLSSFEGNACDKCIFDFEDDIVDENSFIQSDTLQNEMRHYKSLTMSAADKDNSKCFAVVER